MTIVVVGGGPTGVELAGAFAELTRTVLQRDFKRIDPSQARVVMIEARPRVLAQFSPELSASAQRQLIKLGRRSPDGRQGEIHQPEPPGSG